MLIESPLCNSPRLLLVQVQNPPRVFQRGYHGDCKGALHADFQYSFSKGTKEEPWARSTDFTPNSSIGQAWAYLLECPDLKLEGIKDLFQKLADFKLAEYSVQAKRVNLKKGGSAVPRQMLVPIVEAPEDMDIAFELMFKVNELVQYGKLIPEHLNKNFYKILQPRWTPHEYAKLVLREILEMKSAVCWDPVQVFLTALKHQGNKVRAPISGSVKLERSLLSVHRLAITPTKVYCYGPEVDLSNRVTREFKDKVDNFLRVTFIEEDWEEMSASALTTGFDKGLSPRLSRVYDRFLRVMREGVQLGGKKYEFLAFSSSQLRERSFWMFASTGDVTPDSIREWMGNFLSIRNVAQCAARMGQCFSSSTPTLEVPSRELELIEDVERVHNKTSIKYCFSDGIGKISEDFAKQVGRKCGLRRMGVSMAPSAFQIRYGGYKGVVAVDPNSSYKLSLRPSMRKFSSEHIGLEVLGWAQFLPCYLNRQIISLLSTLGIADHVFENLQERVVTQLDAMIEDPVVALEVLQVSPPA
jgi:RNA-dependent RNA polymerase